MTRRAQQVVLGFCPLLVAVVLLTATLVAAPLAAQASEWRIGFLGPLTGVFAATGRDMLDGFTLYLERVNYRFGNVAVRVIAEDDQLNPGVALTKARKLVDSDRVHLLAGIVSSPATYALREYIDSRQVPTVVAVAAGDDVTQRIRAQYLIRLGWGSSSQAAHPFGAYVAQELKYTRVLTIADDFAFGHEWVGGFQRSFEQAGGQVVRKLWVPLGTSDFSPYLAQIPRDIDAVVSAVVGAPAVRFMKQYQDFGFKGRLPLIGPGHMTDESLLPQLGDEALGVLTVLHYSATLEHAENQAFVQAFQARFGRVPSAYSEAGYTAALWLDRALRQLDAIPADGATVLKALGQVGPVVTPRGPVALDSYGNVVHNIYVRRVDRAEGGLQNTIVHTFPQVSQFWRWHPEEYLTRPVYTRD